MCIGSTSRLIDQSRGVGTLYALSFGNRQNIGAQPHDAPRTAAGRCLQ